MKTNKQGLYLALTFVACLAFAAQPARAAAYGYVGESYYVGIGVINWTFTQYNDPITGTASASGLYGYFGASLSPIVSVEAHIASGGVGQSGTALGTVYMSSLGGTYIRVNAPLGSLGDIHALFGFTELMMDNGVTFASQFGVSYGFGAMLSLGHSVALRADYMRYLETITWRASALTFSVTVNL